MAVVATSVAGLADLVALSSRATHAARVDMLATLAAESKIAELRALPFTWDAAHAPVTDPALTVSPSSSLTADVAGYRDLLDVDGQVVPAALAGRGVLLRRWSIQPLPADPLNALVLQVVTAPVTQPQSRSVHLVSILARTAS